MSEHRTVQFVVKQPCSARPPSEPYENLPVAIWVYPKPFLKIARCGGVGYFVALHLEGLSESGERLQVIPCPGSDGAMVCEHMGHLIE